MLEQDRKMCQDALRRGDPETVVRRLIQVLRDHDDDPAVWGYLGIAYGEMGRPEEAMQSLRQAVRMDPSSASLHYNLGRAFEVGGQLSDAQESYRRSLELDPSSARARLAAARLRGSDDEPAAAAQKSAFAGFAAAAERALSAIAAKSGRGQRIGAVAMFLAAGSLMLPYVLRPRHAGTASGQRASMSAPGARRPSALEASRERQRPMESDAANAEALRHEALARDSMARFSSLRRSGDLDGALDAAASALESRAAALEARTAASRGRAGRRAAGRYIIALASAVGL